MKVLHVRRAPGYAAPLTSGVIADVRSPARVLDAANNALYFYNATQNYGFYRAGAPARPVVGQGAPRPPRAITIWRPVLGGNYWIADTGNAGCSAGPSRHHALDGPTPRRPATRVRQSTPRVPVISGTPEVGQSRPAATASGATTRTPSARVWRRDGVTIDGATSTCVRRHLRRRRDRPQLRGDRHNQAGASGPASSVAVSVPGGVDPPVKTCRASRR